MDTRQAQKPCLRIKIRRNVLLGIPATGFCTSLRGFRGFRGVRGLTGFNGF